MVASTPEGLALPRTNGMACSAKPSCSIARPPSVTRVATCTSNPASRAARAIGRRCDRKAQSSVTTYNRRGAVAEQVAAACSPAILWHEYWERHRIRDRLPETDCDTWAGQLRGVLTLGTA